MDRRVDKRPCERCVAETETVAGTQVSFNNYLELLGTGITCVVCVWFPIRRR